MSDRNESNSSDRRTFVTKKDFVYWIIFLVIIIIFLLVWKWNNEQQLTNQISLAGSVSSILLALIAISYAFFQSQSSSNENKLMMQTLLKINDEINKLEAVNNSLNSLRKDFINMKDESSDFQDKMESSLTTLRSALEDKSWIESLETASGEKISGGLKEKIEEEYISHIQRNLETAFKIDSEIMAKTMSFIHTLDMGEIIDEEKLKKYLYEKHNIKADNYDIFVELQKMNEVGIVSLMVNEKDPDKRVFAIKTAQPDLLKMNK